MTASSTFRKGLVLLLWLGVWQLAASAVGQAFLLPGPADVAAALWQLGGTRAFWRALSATLLRVLLGLGAGAAAGTALACLTHCSAWAGAILAPAIRALRAAPVVSFILLLLLWTPRGSVPAAVAALMVVPVLWQNVSRGLAEADPRLLEAARALRFSPGKTARLVYLPSALPYFLSGTATAAGLAWKSGVAAEALCLPPLAVGSGMQAARLYLETPDLFAWTFAAVALSLGFEALLIRLLGRMEGRWRP